MSNNDPTKWAYFEAMPFVEFLNLCEFYKDKQTQKELEELANGRKR